MVQNEHAPEFYNSRLDFQREKFSLETLLEQSLIVDPKR